MAEPQDVPIPEIYVLWHPKCELGEKLARRILPWFRPGNGLGPEVFYRSTPRPGAPAGGRPPPMPGEPGSVTEASMRPLHALSNLQIVLPLIDENMVADQAWRRWLAELSRPGGSARVMMPVALDATAYNMPSPLNELNFLRPAGLPLPAGEPIGGRAYEAVVRSMLKQITEATCRVLLPRRGASGSPPRAASEPLPKINIFLSHAKLDGTVPARRLRDYIYSQTQLTAFYDENDIAFGSAFSRVIQDGLNSSDTAALIAVRSAAYAGRPWCRREISLFRRPRQPESKAEQKAELAQKAEPKPQRWFLYPTLVVEAMEASRSSSGVAEFGNSTLIRWTDDDPDLEELIVTSVIRDAMLASFHAALGASMPSGDEHVVINWQPDPATLLHIPRLRSPAKCNVYYPGRGLSGLELDNLAELFPALTFHSFEEALS
jgi:hypothetical protein